MFNIFNEFFYYSFYDERVSSLNFSIWSRVIFVVLIDHLK